MIRTRPGEVTTGDSRGSDRTVTVLGAGVAGLAAAFELEQLGYRVEVLEGSDRLGGRIHSHRFGPDLLGPVAELGAMRIPAGHRHTLDYVALTGLAGQLRTFPGLRPGAGPGTGPEADPVAAALRELRAGLPAGRYRDRTLRFAAELVGLADAVAPLSVRRQVRHDARSVLLDRLDRLDLQAHLTATGQPDLRAFFTAHPQVRAACSGDLRGFLDDLLTETGDGLLRIRGGTSRLVERLARRIQGPVLTGREVVGIQVRPDEVLLQVRRHDRTVLRRSRYVVCTIPFPVLRRVQLTGVSADKRDVIQQVRYVSATKVAFHCREAFWSGAGITDAAASTGGLLRQTYYPAVDGDPALGAVLLASYTLGDEAEALGRMPAAARHAAVLGELAEIHPELRRPGMVLGAASVAWDQHRWTGGGCTVRWGQDAASAEEERSRAAQPERGLFFAGEHCSGNPAWIDGAIGSARDAVAELVGRDRGRAMAA
ncbi:MAG TPA: NAD(P)/FAD-dependent oxidoreductase [Mycobacteriales bacterium]|jgi:monoamine oxidase|nr:NAD(P)/FAD-dependent oxidoreductase [Mycobacteriales bacterium]